MLCPNPNVLSHFFVLFMFGIFYRKGWRLPNSKLVEELFCLFLEICQEGGVGYLIPKLLRNFSA